MKTKPFAYVLIWSMGKSIPEWCKENKIQYGIFLATLNGVSCAPKAVRRITEALKYDWETLSARTEWNGQRPRKLRASTEEIWQDWKRLRDKGLTYQAIADSYRVSRQAVHQALAILREHEEAQLKQKARETFIEKAANIHETPYHPVSYLAGMRDFYQSVFGG